MKVEAAIVQPEARVKARTRVSPQQSQQTAPPHSPPSQEHTLALAKKPRSNRKNRKNRKPNGEHQFANMMIATPTRTYVPPHLRKKRPAAPAAPAEPKIKSKIELKVEPKADVRLGDFGDFIGISATPPASVKSRLSKPTQDQVSP